MWDKINLIFKIIIISVIKYFNVIVSESTVG